MRKLDLYWRSNPDWWELNNHIPTVKKDAPLEAQESYQIYLQQTSSERNRDNTKERTNIKCRVNKDLLQKFIREIQSGNIEIYNEFSLQHELGIYLRNALPNYKVEFERNVSFFNISNTIKKEIDIVVYNDSEKFAIELKHPLNGQYPEQMYSFIKDIRFMEELKEKEFDNTYCLTLVKDKNFYSGNNIDGVYSFFRAGNTIKGIIKKPTGKTSQFIKLSNEYRICWKSCNKLNYYIIEL